MNFRDFSGLNSALMAKQVYKLIRYPNALWARILKAIYFPNSAFL